MKIFFTPLLFLSLLSCAQSTEKVKPLPMKNESDSLQTAYFAAGCFWCVEAVFESIDGVKEVVSGYSGGTEENPSYEMVSSGATGHAETVLIFYDSTVVSYDTLLVAFFGSHDPSTLNQQGPDIGTQYRSIVFYTNEYEKQKTQDYINELLRKEKYSKITTEVVPLNKFYRAEIYHQDYERNNPENPYVKRISIPRLNNFKYNFPHLLKAED